MTPEVAAAVERERGRIADSRERFGLLVDKMVDDRLAIVDALEEADARIARLEAFAGEHHPLPAGLLDCDCALCAARDERAAAR